MFLPYTTAIGEQTRPIPGSSGARKSGGPSTRIPIGRIEHLLQSESHLNTKGEAGLSQQVDKHVPELRMHPKVDEWVESTVCHGEPVKSEIYVGENSVSSNLHKMDDYYIQKIVWEPS